MLRILRPLSQDHRNVLTDERDRIILKKITHGWVDIHNTAVFIQNENAIAHVFDQVPTRHREQIHELVSKNCIGIKNTGNGKRDGRHIQIGKFSVIDLCKYTGSQRNNGAKEDKKILSPNKQVSSYRAYPQNIESQQNDCVRIIDVYPKDRTSSNL